MSFLLEKGNFHCHVRLPECTFLFELMMKLLFSHFGMKILRFPSKWCGGGFPNWVLLEPPVSKICAGQTGSFPPFVWVKCMKKTLTPPPKKCVKTRLKHVGNKFVFGRCSKVLQKLVVGRHAFLVPFSEGISSKRVG